jgi:hypothetical protein
LAEEHHWALSTKRTLLSLLGYYKTPNTHVQYGKIEKQKMLYRAIIVDILQ